MFHNTGEACVGAYFGHPNPYSVLLVVSLFVFCLIEMRYTKNINYMLFALCHGLLNLSIMVIGLKPFNQQSGQNGLG